jgi:proton-dependent oligopeptide transporter, POT family
MENTERRIFGHSPGLFVLFATEMWERFSFYGMKALLIFYLTKYHLFTDDAGNILVGSYAAMVYAFPVIGGYVADKYLGFRKAVLLGGILLVLGHLGMAFEGSAASRDAAGVVTQDNFALQVFYFSMALIIVGVGFLKGNISSIVGSLYEEGDDRRDSGFTIFYMGINMGSFFATLLCGWLGEKFGWNYGFGAAGIGMFFGLMVFMWGQKYFKGKAEPPDLAYLQTSVFGGISREWVIYILAILFVFVSWGIVQNHTIVEMILIAASIAALVRIIYFAINKATKIERDRLFVLTILIIFSVIFWALFEQAYTSMNLFADRVIDRTVFGRELPASWFLSLNALFIILFAPVFAWIWVELEKFNKNPNALNKFGLGIVLAGIGFGFLVLGCKGVSEGGQVAPIYLVLAYAFHSWGELCVSPVGLSSVTRYSPVRIVGFMMGVWFLATAGAEYIAGLLAKIASVDTSAPDSANGAVGAYENLFSILFYMGLIFGGVLLAITPFLKRFLHDKE